MAEENSVVTPVFIDISINEESSRIHVDFDNQSKEVQQDIKDEMVKQEFKGNSDPDSTTNITLELEMPTQNEKMQCTELLNNAPCWYRTTTEDRMIRHIRKVHRGENPFQCTMCDYSTYNKALFEEHIRIHQGIKPFKCRYCPYRSVSKKNTKKHEQIHRPDNPLKCPECDFIGRHDRSLRLHIKTHLPNIPCSKCDFKAKDSEAMKAHKSMHITRKWYKCDICSTRFAESRNLDAHKKKRMKKCDECDALLCNKLMFSKHMSTVHGKATEGALFTCAVCNWSCMSRPRALLHLIHHPAQPTEALGDLNILKQFGILR